MQNFLLGFLLGSWTDDDDGGGCGSLIFGIIILGIIAYVINRFTQLLDKAQNGGTLYYLLYPFIFQNGFDKSGIYWSSFFTVIVVLLIIGINYFILSKKIPFIIRPILIIVNIYSLILGIYKIIIGVANSESFLKAGFLIILPLIVLGFINGVLEENSLQENRKNAKPIFPDTNEILRNPGKFGLTQVGPERLVIENNPIHENEKMYFSLFGATFFQRGYLPTICELEQKKPFYNAGISIGSEIRAIKFLEKDEEYLIENMEDLYNAYQYISSGEKLAVQILVGRNTTMEKIKNIYVEINNHVQLISNK